jgi:cell division protein FtsI (penicillin-binding protein 3)
MIPIIHERSGLGRLGVILFIIAAAVLIIVWRYVSLMLLSPGRDGTISNSAVVERGPIMDRNGRPLAIQTRLHSVTAWIPDIEDVETTSRQLAEILDMPAAEIVEIIKARTRFAYIKRKISNTTRNDIIALKEEGFLRGISLEEEFARTYPQQTIASHILGIVDIDNKGLEGLELMYNDILSPTKKYRNQEEVYGSQLFLTIDLIIQYFAETIAKKAYDENNADSVMILAMGAKTGDFLAYVSMPTFNPNSYNDFPVTNRTNRPAVSAYEPGSVFKIFSLSSFLDLGGITPSDEFFCEGYYEHPDIRGRIECLGTHGEVNAYAIIKHSCNAGAAYASETVDSVSFHNMITRFGFGRITQLPFAGESYGILDGPAEWSARSKPTIAFGQEISTSAVQVIAAASVFANSGIMLEPHIVKKIVSPEGQIVEEYSRKPVAQVVTAETAQTMLAMMEATTERTGTAWRAAIEGVRVSAKTGTGEIYNAQTGQYSDDDVIASCIAIFPTDDPQIILYVVIEKPKEEETYGGRIAAPLIKELGEEIVTYLGIKRTNDEVQTHSGSVNIEQSPVIELQSDLPDFSGYSKRDLVRLLNDERIILKIVGSGWAVRQSPEPGTIITDGMTVVVELE